MNPDWIIPDWPAPAAVRAFSTTRAGGFSTGPWEGLNLGSNCSDTPDTVRLNRAQLREELPADPCWLHQVHGVTVLRHRADHAGQGTARARDIRPEADAQVCRRAGLVCAILTADCLPVLFCNRAGTTVAAAHAGWRGLAAGILERTVVFMDEPPDEILAWLGPAIGPAAYEVGEEVRREFLHRDPGAAAAFQSQGERWLLDLCQVARQRLASVGVSAIYGGAWCTYSDATRFYSHRRDGITGRMASLVWLRE